MFSQRKSFWKSRWVILIIIVFIGAGYWLSQRENSSDGKDPSENGLILGQDTVENGNEIDEKSVGKDAVVNVDSEQKKEENFYLIKKSNGSVDVFYYEGEGEPGFVKSTDIEFSLLGKEDQKSLIDGIIVETKEELNELLQDFGS